MRRKDHPSRFRPRRSDAYANYDELYPNGDDGTVAGKVLPGQLNLFDGDTDDEFFRIVAGLDSFGVDS